MPSAAQGYMYLHTSDLSHKTSGWVGCSELCHHPSEPLLNGALERAAHLQKAPTHRPSQAWQAASSEAGLLFPLPSVSHRFGSKDKDFISKYVQFEVFIKYARDGSIRQLEFWRQAKTAIINLRGNNIQMVFKSTCKWYINTELYKWYLKTGWDDPERKCRKMERRPSTIVLLQQPTLVLKSWSLFHTFHTMWILHLLICDFIHKKHGEHCTCLKQAM